MKRTYRSYAKINLHLQVIGRRSDGYHELRTVFQTVDLHDRVTVELGGEGIELAVEGLEVPVGPANLAHRAAALFVERWAPGLGVRVRLEKSIPVGGGLGGGSGNAATVLAALQEMLEDPAPPGELWALARELGADVPFFLVGGTALGFGRGDEVVPLPDLAESEVWLATPPVAISTAEVFAALGDLTPLPVPSSIMALALGQRDAGLTGLEGRNDLEGVVFGRYPPVRRLHDSLLAAGAESARLSGSGATLFAVFDDPPSAEGLAAELPDDTRLVRARTLSRPSIAQGRLVG